MPTSTSRFLYNKPLVNNATDADLWGGQLNANWDDLDSNLSLQTATKTSNFSVVATEFNFTYLVDSSSGAVTATLPLASSVFSGFAIRFKATDITNTITIDGNGAETIDGQATFTIEAVNQTFEIVCDGTNWQVIGFSPEEGTAGQVLTSQGVGKTPKFEAGVSPIELFTSTAQTITAQGSLTLPHGLTATPFDVGYYLVCTTAELGYNIGDIALPTLTQSEAGSIQISYGISIVPDATDLNIRYGQRLMLINHSSGLFGIVTLANWDAYFFAKVI